MTSPHDGQLGRPNYPDGVPFTLVDELEKLTRDRNDATRPTTPTARARRQDRIDQIVAEIKGYRQPVAGSIVANSRLTQFLGKGHFGIVWEAHDVRTEKPCAVKFFDSDRLGVELTLYHFRRGVRAMKLLRDHDGRPESVVRLHHAQMNGLAFSMRLMEDGDLTHIERRGWSTKKKLRVFRSVCEATRFAHRAGVFHRDIKPANIVMASSGAPVLTDFDIADFAFLRTQTMQALGTVAYAPPEQLEGAGRKDPTGDIYSLGRLLYYLLAERDPSLNWGDLPTLTDLQHDTGLVNILRRCTLGTPDARYQDVDALLEDLARYKDAPDDVGIALLADQSAGSDETAQTIFSKAVELAEQREWDGAISAGEHAISRLDKNEHLLRGRWRKQIDEWGVRTGQPGAFRQWLSRYIFGRVPLVVAALFLIASGAIVTFSKGYVNELGGGLAKNPTQSQRGLAASSAGPSAPVPLGTENFSSEIDDQAATSREFATDSTGDDWENVAETAEHPESVTQLEDKHGHDWPQHVKARVRLQYLGIALVDRRSVSGANFSESVAVRWKSPVASPDLSGILLSGSDLRVVSVTRAKWTAAKLDGCDARSADFRGGDFSYATFAGPRTKLYRAKLGSIEGARSRFIRTDFSGANLVEADFEGADLSHAVFRHARVRNANFRETAGLTSKQVCAMLGWEDAMLPANVAAAARKKCGKRTTNQ